ncbi:hypothetical protein JHW43_001943 [Diplocarpon mali]|nr:hypothetical protein JHW43_001943 [Diplocarpon mali]
MGRLRASARLQSVSRLPARYTNKNKTLRSIQPHSDEGRAQWPRRNAGLSNASRQGALKPSTQHFASRSGSEEANYVRLGTESHSTRLFDPVYLRDACTCSRCVDPSSRQKDFQTTDIPQTIKSKSVEHRDDGSVQVTWENDIPGFGTDHTSTYTPMFTATTYTLETRRNDHSEKYKYRSWNSRRIREEFQFVNFEEYINDDEKLYRALALLKTYGILLVRGVPKSEESVAKIAERIGTIRDTFYGRTWDVRSTPEAKNVAYTHQHLGLHMDLLYMKNPPGIQLLHCINNSCKGGESIFSDSFYAVKRLSRDDQRVLGTANLAYHYRQPENHYYQERPLIEYKKVPIVNKGKGEVRFKLSPVLEFVNYSPPFQAKIPLSVAQQINFQPLARALRSFAKLVEDPHSLYEYRLKEGECVIFNNRRILHGRRGFSHSQGSRLLRGTYIDTDVFDSRWCVLHERYKDAGVCRNYETMEQAAEGSLDVDHKFVDEEYRKLILEERNVREAKATENE